MLEKIKELIPFLSETKSRARYQLYQYQSDSGVFDYERYKKIQTEGNKHKINRTWAVEENIKYLADYISSSLQKPQFGLCHGTRNGNEIKWFKKYLDCEMLGTEISETATRFEETIQWDFHEIKEEWIDSADFIYSNSFDHSYDPEYCLNNWMKCLKSNGICIIEHSSAHSPDGVTELDPFGADIAIMPYLILTWGKGKYSVREIIDAPFKISELDYLKSLLFKIIKWKTSSTNY